MRTLITIVIAALSLNAFGQGIPQLPYNPDENGDGLIGVPDLQGLLSQYGLEFNSAVLSEDAQSAIVYMGEMAHPVCSQACDNLPGFWNMSTMADLGLVWDEIISSSSNTWINVQEISSNFHFFDTNDDHLQATDYTNGPNRCYCAAHELPKVEYKHCVNLSELEINNLASQGWRLLDDHPMNSLGDIYGVMWRWAE